jgi:hypothetical protein
LKPEIHKLIQERIVTLRSKLSNQHQDDAILEEVKKELKSLIPSIPSQQHWEIAARTVLDKSNGDGYANLVFVDSIISVSRFGCLFTNTKLSSRTNSNANIETVFTLVFHFQMASTLVKTVNLLRGKSGAREFNPPFISENLQQSFV